MPELKKRVVTSFAIGTVGIIIFFLLPPVYFSVLLAALYLYILAFELPKLFEKNHSLWILFPLWPTLSFITMIWLNQSTDRNLMFALFLIIFSSDIGAYFFGTKFGKHKIAPKLSPQKSWEGFLGGYLFSLGAAFILTGLFCYEHNALKIAFITLLLIVAATLGDFFESYLKRQACLKDSGNILPGHGGFLDRLDGVLIAVLLFFLLKEWGFLGCMA